MSSPKRDRRPSRPSPSTPSSSTSMSTTTVETERASPLSRYRRASQPHVINVARASLEHSTPLVAVTNTADSDHEMLGVTFDARYAIGRPILTTQSTHSEEELGPFVPMSKKKSSVAQTSLSNATRSSQYSRRRSSNVPTERRGSLPALHLRAPSASSSSVFVRDTRNSDDHHMQDDLYSNLQSFTFGDAPERSSPSSSSSHSLFDSEMMSPFTRINGGSSASADRTPRASVCTVRTKHGQDEDELIRRGNRAKMRAIDDGGRRPSLPTNSHSSSTSSISSMTSADSSASDARQASSSRLRPTVHDPLSHSFSSSDSDQEQETDHFVTESEFDTDLELDSEVAIISDAASVHSHHTFGIGAGREYDMPIVISSGTHVRLSFSEDRRASLPWDIPSGQPSVTRIGVDGVGYGSGTSATARRASRSVDYDIHSATNAAGLPGSDPVSEPRSRGDWSALEAHAQQQHQAQLRQDEQREMGCAENVYEGLDLGYIFSSAADSDQGHQKQNMHIPPSARSPNASSLNPFGFDFAWGAPIGGPSAAGGRRPSAATVGTLGDDTFMRHVKQNDSDYDQRRLEWSFKREPLSANGAIISTEQGPSIRGSGSVMNPKMAMGHPQELWRCQWVGRFKVEKVISTKTNDPSKPPQQHLHVSHVIDPFSKGNMYGGASSLIHKHSRAIAFSLYRMHGLLSPNKSQGKVPFQKRLPNAPMRDGQPASETTSSVRMLTEYSILLAPKSVQEHYTSTKTVSKLSTHGLLKENADGHKSGSGRSGRHHHHSSSGVGERPPRERRHSEKGRRRDTEKEKPNSGDGSAQGSGAGTSSQTSSGMSGSEATEVSTSSNAKSTGGRSRGYSRASPPSPVPPPLPPKSEHSYPPPPSTSSSTTLAFQSQGTPSTVAFDRPQSSGGITPSVSSPRTTAFEDSRHSSSSDRSTAVLRGRARGTDDILDYNEHPLSRSSHAEAFATLDTSLIEYMRSKSDKDSYPPHHHLLDQDSPPSRFGFAEKMRRRLLGPPVKGASKSPPNTAPPSASLEGNYTPPWITMAPRSQQEEQERVMKNLNDSFFEVGLLPSFKQKRRESRSSKSRKDTVGVAIFEQVPNDSLYMLLPLWAGETDPDSSADDPDSDVFNPSVEERQYLLVWYVAFESHNKGKDKDSKKRPRTAVSTNDGRSASGVTSKSVSLSSYRVVARLVSYDDLRGSGIRLPKSGLSVTGPVSAAMREIPRRPARFDTDFDELASVIAVCHGRESGVEFLPEGLEKLGLSTRRMSLDPDADAPLSAIGRAAVEMAWLGCIAVMGFGPGNTVSSDTVSR